MRHRALPPVQPDTERPAPGTAGLRRVFVRDLELMASIGVFEVERRYEQRVVLSIDLWTADEYDGQSDRLADVIDYGEVIARARAIVDSGHVNLIETLADRIAKAVLEDRRVARVLVKIEKPDIVPGCRAVGVEIERYQRA